METKDLNCILENIIQERSLFGEVEMKTTEEIIKEIERRIMELSKFIDYPTNKLIVTNYKLLLDWIKEAPKTQEKG